MNTLLEKLTKIVRIIIIRIMSLERSNLGIIIVSILPALHGESAAIPTNNTCIKPLICRRNTWTFLPFH